MMNPTMFDPISLESWNSDETSSQFLQSKLENYLQNYFPCFYSKPQRNLFQTFVRGLLSRWNANRLSPLLFISLVKSMSGLFSSSSAVPLLMNGLFWKLIRNCCPHKSMPLAACFP